MSASFSSRGTLPGSGGRRPLMFAIYGTCVLCGLILLAVMLTKRPAQLSPKAYECSLAIYTACNQHDAAKLKKIQSLIDDFVEAHELTAPERTRLQVVIQSALQQDWHTANRRARQLLQSQVR